MKVTWDSADVERVFRAYPMEATARLLELIEGEAIDTQRLMRRNVNVGATGRTRRSIKYRIDRSKLGAEIYPDVTPGQAEALEKGSRPHWTSVKPGSDLRRWADHKGINPFALQKSIAMKGTKAHPFVKPTFESARVSVPRNITRAFGRFIEEVNNGRI